tara:strand:- start:1924 stop:2466 length:543 start_codon:yes stop_codon:yes gene_type:complete
MSADFLKKLTVSKLPTILLVGNGPSANELPLGEVVDAFHEVVRFNDYPQTSEYENMVGRRTTTWVLNEDQTGNIRPPMGVSLVRILSEGFSSRFHAETKLVRSHEFIPNPSSGIVMAQTLIKQGIRVYTLGMDGYSGERRRYWETDSTGPVSDRRRHNQEMEQRFWNENRQTIIPIKDVV